MNLHVATAVRDNGLIKAIRDALDADTNPGYIEFYTSPQPTGGAAITTQTKLGTCEFSKPSGSISAAVLTLDMVSDDLSADASGDIAWARLKDGAGNYVMDGDCGDAESTALIKFNTVTVIAGGVVKIISGTLTEGNP
jgi:hypothetical protein